MRLAFFLNLFFAVVELVGGILTNSVAIISDAIHDFGDACAIGTGWFFEKLGHRGRDPRHTYGYRRYSIIGAIVNTIILITGSILVVQEAISRLSSPQDVHVPGMIGLALLGILVNGLAFAKLHPGHSHNKAVVRLHLLEDVLGWVAVLLGSIVMFFSGWTILDPVLSILIAAFILWNAIRRLRASLRIIVQGVPTGIDVETLVSAIRSMDFVDDTHDVHIWTLDGEKHVMTIHVVLEESAEASKYAEYKTEIRNLTANMGIAHLTVELETTTEECVLEKC